MTESVVVALARKINEAFPELDGQAFAVSEAQVNKERMPRLPACMVALQHETMHRGRLDARSNAITERLIVDFWLSPEEYKLSDPGGEPAPVGAETVYYAFYDYGVIRDRLLSALRNWTSPQGAVLGYVKLEIAADKFAVTLTFSFDHVWNWCADEAATPQQQPFKLLTCIRPKVQ